MNLFPGINQVSFFFFHFNKIKSEKINQKKISLQGIFLINMQVIIHYTFQISTGIYDYQLKEKQRVKIENNWMIE